MNSIKNLIFMVFFVMAGTCNATDQAMFTATIQNNVVSGAKVNLDIEVSIDGVRTIIKYGQTATVKFKNICHYADICLRGYMGRLRDHMSLSIQDKGSYTIGFETLKGIKLITT